MSSRPGLSFRKRLSNRQLHTGHMLATLPEDFAPLFRSREIVQGRDDEWMQRVFELRYQVYCKECGFLPADRYPDHRETDVHDATSVHFCAFNLRDELVGYVRMVHPGLTPAFPFQDRFQTPAGQAVEISRLMVTQAYRRRRGDVLAGVTAADEPPSVHQDLRDHTPQILLSLYRQVYAYSLAHGTRYWYAAMERTLARALGQMGFGFEKISPLVDYYGPVALYLGDLRRLEAQVGQHNPALMAWLRRGRAGAH
jgi:N-acyl amino acid synthase of PEP-CTERM/exosortase system